MRSTHVDCQRLESRNTLQLVRIEIARLSPTRAEALLLHDVLGYELSEVAAIVGVTVAAAQSRLVRGRKELHGRLRTKNLLTAEEK